MNAIEIKNLTKHYNGFTLDNISLTLPQGCILGLIGEKGCVASKILNKYGVTEEKITDLIDELIPPAGKVGVLDREGFSPRAEEVLEDADRQAKRFKAKKTGTEHLLIAIIRGGDNVAIRMLLTLSVNIQKLYMDTISAMGVDPMIAKDDLNPRKRNNPTKTLDQYSRDLTALAADDMLDPIIGRESEILRVIQIFLRLPVLIRMVILRLTVSVAVSVVFLSALSILFLHIIRGKAGSLLLCFLKMSLSGSFCHDIGY